MNQLSIHITAFLQELNIDADQGADENYRDYLLIPIERFLHNESKETAYEIYDMFFKLYGHSTGAESVSFIRLLEKMRGYEENAAVLTQKQRDHFIHSINVFLLGLAIYQCNQTFRSLFEERLQPYQGQRKTPREEFFYRWGLAALCHDIGYPVEIITNQINDFINFTHQLHPADAHIYARVEYDRFELVNTIPERISKRDFIHDYYEKHAFCVYLDLLKPVDLLAHELHLRLGVDLTVIQERLNGYLPESSRIGRVDHGFYSAIILLKWYGYLIQCANLSPDQLYYPVLDSASAILLHNYYQVGMVRSTSRPNPFGLGPMHPSKHPLAYLLILCDELQEWNREPYGELDKMRVAISKAAVLLEDGQGSVTYIVDKGVMPEEFVGQKINTLNTLLDVAALFPAGFSVGCEAVSELPPLGSEPPPLLLGKLEQLAIAIHNRYNATTHRLRPEKKIEYQNFSDLPAFRKYFNLRSAQEIPKEVATVGCEIRVLGQGDEALRVRSFTADEIEILAGCEHDRWMRGRKELGWSFGKAEDESHHPNMVAYDTLDDEAKEYDRDPARNLPVLLEGVGLGIYRKKTVSIVRLTKEEIELLAREIHRRYKVRREKDHPEEMVPPFDEISEIDRESNRRQARGIPNKLRHIGCVLLPLGTAGHGEPIDEFPVDMVEFLARIEHDEWSGEKTANGFVWGPKRDNVKKHNPCLVDYDQLTEELKDYDRDAVRGIPSLAEKCGYGVYKVEDA